MIYIGVWQERGVFVLDEREGKGRGWLFGE
jgi:hypothetical protein